MVVLAVDSRGQQPASFSQIRVWPLRSPSPGDRSRIAVGDKFLRLGFRALIHQVPGVGVALQYR